jgi:hypothetical protein
MKLTQGLFLFGFASAAPELGCYFYDMSMPDTGLSVQAQVDVKSSSALDFSVLLNIPYLGFENSVFACPQERFEFDDSASIVTVGLPPVSACLTGLSALTKGVLNPPVYLEYNAAAKTLTTNLVIDVTLSKQANCRTFGTTAAPVSSTTNAVATTITTAGPGPAADNTSTTTNSASSLGFSILLGAVILASM